MRQWIRVPLTACVLCLVAACSAGTSDSPGPSTSSVTAQAPAVVQPVPVSVRIPSIGAEGDLIPLGVDDKGGTAEPPVEKPQLGSWYEPGVRPGAVGPAVVLGHINGGGKPGLFAKLAQAKVGDRIEISREDGSKVVFEAYKIDSIVKTDFPKEAVYGNTDVPEIRLITCGGELDRVRHRYLSNTIVYGKIVTD